MRRALSDRLSGKCLSGRCRFPLSHWFFREVLPVYPVHKTRKSVLLPGTKRNHIDTIDGKETLDLLEFMGYLTCNQGLAKNGVARIPLSCHLNVLVATPMRFKKTRTAPDFCADLLIWHDLFTFFRGKLMRFKKNITFVFWSQFDLRPTGDAIQENSNGVRFPAKQLIWREIFALFRGERMRFKKNVTFVFWSVICVLLQPIRVWRFPSSLPMNSFLSPWTDGDQI